MEIYQVAHDHAHYKFHVFKEEGSSKRAITFKGQSLTHDWQPLHIELFQGGNPQERAASSFITASCYFQGMLFVKASLAGALKELLKEKIELLPVIADGKADEYVYVNVLNVVDAIKKDNVSISELMAKIKARDLDFYQERTNGELIFRDNKMSHVYYCSPSFVKVAEEIGLKGLRFELAGIAS